MMRRSGDIKRKATCKSLIVQQQARSKLRCHGPRISLATTSKLGNISDDARITMPVLELPEDVLHHIHSLMPLRDAARAACVSRSFLCSWRHFPKLTFSLETLGPGTIFERAKKLPDIIDRILENHTGIGLKTFDLDTSYCSKFMTANQINIWLQHAINSEMVELALRIVHLKGPELNFPCSLLSRAASSLQSLFLTYCSFHPTLTIGCLRNLKTVYLVFVNITDEELGCFFSCTISLRKIQIIKCPRITSLKIPSHLQQLSFLEVSLCTRLHMIVIDTPKLTTFLFYGSPIKILISDSTHLKLMCMNGGIFAGMFQHVMTNLHSIAPNLQTLALMSSSEAYNMPAPPGKFLHLRELDICCKGTKYQSFDFLSLVSFLGACPALQIFFLSVAPKCDARQDSIFKDSNADSWHIRRMPEFHHDKLKKVTIIGFCSAESLIELTCHILENSPSLQRLFLDTTTGYRKRGLCDTMDRVSVIEAIKGVKAIKRFIQEKVPSSVKLQVSPPCGRCHISVLQMHVELFNKHNV